MSFEEIRVIWDSQRERPLYALDDAALHASIRRSSRRFRNLVVMCHLVIAATLAALAVLYLADPLLRGEEPQRALSGALCLALAAAQTVALVRRRAGESRFVDGSIRGDLDLAIWRIDYDIAWVRSLRRWYLVPLVLAMSIDIAFRISGRNVLAWVAVVALLAAASWGAAWEIRVLYLPKKRRFEAIRRQLGDAPS